MNLSSEQPNDAPASPPTAPDHPSNPSPRPEESPPSTPQKPEPPSEEAPVEGGLLKRSIHRLINWPFRARDDVEERWGNITQEWDRIRGGTVARYLFLTKIVLLHARYVFGYIAAGFLVSAPLYMGTKLFNDFSWDSKIFGHIFYSLLDGLICLIPFIVLIPVTQIDWENMRVPEFKIFELALTRWASYIALAYLIVCINLNFFYDMSGQAWWFDLQIAWINFTLMVSAWLRIKIQTLIFRDFYSLESKEDLVLHRKFDDKRSAENPDSAGPIKQDQGSGQAPGEPPETQDSNSLSSPEDASKHSETTPTLPPEGPARE